MIKSASSGGENSGKGDKVLRRCVLGHYFAVSESANITVCPTCGADASPGTPQIMVDAVDAAEVESGSQTLFSIVPPSQGAPKQFPLVSAVFFVILFIVTFGVILTAERVLPVYAFPLVLIGGILTFSVVGAFVLRKDARLSEWTFLDLMRLSFKYLRF
jgi:hypothetical protein